MADTTHEMSCPHCGGALRPGGRLVNFAMPRMLTSCGVCNQPVGVPVVSSGGPWRPEFTDEERAAMRQFVEEHRPNTGGER